MWCENAVLVGGDGVIGVAVSMGGAVGHFAALSLCYFLMHVAIEAHWVAPPPSELLQLYFCRNLYAGLFFRSQGLRRASHDHAGTHTKHVHVDEL